METALAKSRLAGKDSERASHRIPGGPGRGHPAFATRPRQFRLSGLSCSLCSGTRRGRACAFFGSVFLLASTNSLFVDRAWAQFKLVPEKPGNNLAVLKVGRIDMRAEPFSSGYRKVTIQNYNVSAFRAVSDGARLLDRDAGVELWGAATGPDNRGGLEYGAGLVQAVPLEPRKPTTSRTNTGAWPTRVGGHGVVGSRQDETESVMPVNNYAEKILRWELSAIAARG